MGKLIYSMLTSLDGYTEDENGSFDWAAPDEELHQFVNDLSRPVGTHLYGRRMYETMSYWETADADPDAPEIVRDFAGIWQAADKIVYSHSLKDITSARTRIEREFEPDAVRALKEGAVRDLIVAGPDLAAHALRAGLVDELQQFLTPVAVGGGTRYLPDGIRLNLELQELRRFMGGTVYLRYSIKS
jgi:dihydrofolate reductase